MASRTEQQIQKGSKKEEKFWDFPRKVNMQEGNE
jgi:hypothetical protein